VISRFLLEFAFIFSSMKSDYATPLLTKIYNTIGFLMLILAVGLTAFGFYCALTERGGAPLLQIFAYAGGAIILALLAFGVAEAVNFVGRTAYRATQIHSLLLGAETALQNRLRSIEGVLNSINANEIISQMPPPPAAGFRYQVEGAEKGPFTAAEIEAFHVSGIILADTPLIREGEMEWRNYGHYFGS